MNLKFAANLGRQADPTDGGHGRGDLGIPTATTQHPVQ